MHPMIQIGVSSETLHTAAAAIRSIMITASNEQVAIKGLDALTTICQVKNTTVTHCTFTNNYQSEDPSCEDSEEEEA